MTIVIVDASILVELDDAGLLPHLFDLPISFLTVSEVLLCCSPELRESLRCIELQNKLTILYPISQETFAEIIQTNRGLSNADKAALHVAYSQKNVILSGDAFILKWCKSYKLKAYSLEWIVEKIRNAQHKV